MVLNKDFLQVSILIKAYDKDVIKANTVDVQDDTFTLPSSSKELSIFSTSIIRSVHSRSIRCQDDGSVPNKGSTNITCKGEGITDNQELEASTTSGGSETPVTGVLEQSIENDTSAITTSAMDAALNSLNSNVPTVQLIGLYHMMWCIKMQIVKNPPIWPYTDEYRACRSPIISRGSKIMNIFPSLVWFKNYENVRLLVTTSFLSDIVWCAQYELGLDQIMFFSFHNLLKLCKKTEEVAESYRFIGDWNEKPRTIHFQFMAAVLYHIVWCVQNESLPFKGLPISYQEIMTCQSPLIPFNNKTLQEKSLEWWGRSDTLKMKVAFSFSLLMELLYCAKKKIFKPGDMINFDSITGACSKISKHPMNLITYKQFKKTKNTWKKRLRMLKKLKPIYICLGMILLLVGSLGNLITCVVALRKKMRQTSSGIYLSLFAIIDTLFLCVRIIPNVLTFLKGDSTIHLDQLEYYNSFTCKMYPYSLNYVEYLSAWLRLCFTVERTVAVTLPYIYRVHFTRRITFIMVLTCSVILAAANSPVIFFFIGKAKKCETYGIKEDTLIWMDFVFSTIIPFTGIIVSNSIMIYSLCKTRRQRQQLTDSQVDIHKITMMCITTSLCFIMSTAPIRLYTISNNAYLYSYIPVFNTRNVLRVEVKLLLDSFRLINSSVNFLLYLISGSVFRQELFRLVKGTIKPKNPIT